MFLSDPCDPGRGIVTTENCSSALQIHLKMKKKKKAKKPEQTDSSRADDLPRVVQLVHSTLRRKSKSAASADFFFKYTEFTECSHLCTRASIAKINAGR